jgi:hypothetical protein
LLASVFIIVLRYSEYQCATHNKATILPIVSYECKSWSLKLWEKIKQGDARFEAIKAVVIQGTIFWDMTPCSLMEINPRLGRKVLNLLAECLLFGLLSDTKDGGNTSPRNAGVLVLEHTVSCSRRQMERRRMFGLKREEVSRG